MIGQKISHYSVTERLGAGGMGEVYRAADAKLGRDVALKVLPSRFADDAQRMGRLTREAQLLASLNHPNIAKQIAQAQKPLHSKWFSPQLMPSRWVLGRPGLVLSRSF